MQNFNEFLVTRITETLQDTFDTSFKDFRDFSRQAELKLNLTICDGSFANESSIRVFNFKI